MFSFFFLVHILFFLLVESVFSFFSCTYLTFFSWSEACFFPHFLKIFLSLNFPLRRHLRCGGRGCEHKLVREELPASIKGNKKKILILPLLRLYTYLKQKTYLTFDYSLSCLPSRRTSRSTAPSSRPSRTSSTTRLTGPAMTRPR